MAESINSSQQSYAIMNQQIQKKPPSADEMFQKLTNDVGGDGNTITKSQLQDYISELETNSSEKEKGKLGFLKQLASNFDTISGGNDSITASDLESNMELLKPQGGPPPAKSSNDMLSSLLSKVDTDGDGVSKTDLQSYLKELESGSTSESKETEIISKLLDDFDSISDENGLISEDSLKSAFGYNNRFDWQDPSTISSEQLEPPIDIRV